MSTKMSKQHGSKEEGQAPSKKSGFFRGIMDNLRSTVGNPSGAAGAKAILDQADAEDNLKPEHFKVETVSSTSIDLSISHHDDLAVAWVFTNQSAREAASLAPVYALPSI